MKVNCDVKDAYLQSKAIYAKKGNKMTTNKQNDVILSMSMSKHPNKNSEIVKLDKNISSCMFLGEAHFTPQVATLISDWVEHSTQQQ